MTQPSRQFTRQLKRIEAKRANRLQLDEERKEAQRSLLERQTKRERADFYGRPVATALSPSRSRITKRKVRKGEAFGRYLTETFHATKGHRISRKEAN